MTRQRILILGGTGGTGQHVLAGAARAGHDVTVLVRSPERLPHTSGRVRVFTGSADDSDSLASAVAGQDAVISTLGVGSSLKSAGLIARCTPVIIRAMEAHGVRRLIFTSAYGVGDTWRDVPPLPRLVMRVLLRDLYRDKAAGEDILRPSALDWTLVYPTTLTNGERTGRCQIGERLSLRGFPTVSRTDVADFLLTQVDDRRFLRKGVLISRG